MTTRIQPPQRQPNDFALLYLFSYDAEVQPSPTRVNTPTGQLISIFLEQNLSTVYNVYGETTIPGVGQHSLKGRIEWGNDQVLIGYDDVARADILATIVTEDEVAIDLRYNVVGYLGAGGGRRLIEREGRDAFGSEDFPFEAPFTTSPRFETTHPSYRWLNEIQGIGYGKFQLVRNEFRRVTCDVYALT